jgi:hypothetical protein
VKRCAVQFPRKRKLHPSWWVQRKRIEEEAWVEVEVRLFSITAAQPGHLARDCQNPCTTCNYCNSFDHVIEDCPVLLAKV